MSLLQAPARPVGPFTRSLGSNQARSSHLAAPRRLRRPSLRVRAENNKNPLDALRDVVARRPVAQKAVLRLLLSPGLTGTLAVAGCYLAKMSSPLSALLAAPTASDVAIGLAAAVPLVALDALLLWPDYSPEAPPKRLGVVPTPAPPSSPSSVTAKGPAEKAEDDNEEEKKREEEDEPEKSGGGPAKRPDPAVVEAGRLALLRSLSASGVAVFDAGALVAGSTSSSSSPGGENSGESDPLVLARRRLRAAAHAYASRAVRSTLAREIPGNPAAEAALVVAARAGTELLARSFALRLAGGWVADRVVEGGGLAGEDALVSLLAAVRAPPDAPLGTAGEVLVLAATAAGLVGIGVAGVVAAEAETARSAAELERRSKQSSSSSTEEAVTDASTSTFTSTSATAAALGARRPRRPAADLEGARRRGPARRLARRREAAARRRRVRGLGRGPPRGQPALHRRAGTAVQAPAGLAVGGARREGQARGARRVREAGRGRREVFGAAAGNGGAEGEAGAVAQEAGGAEERRRDRRARRRRRRREEARERRRRARGRRQRCVVAKTFSFSLFFLHNEKHNKKNTPSLPAHSLDTPRSKRQKKRAEKGGKKTTQSRSFSPASLVKRAEVELRFGVRALRERPHLEGLEVGPRLRGPSAREHARLHKTTRQIHLAQAPAAVLEERGERGSIHLEDVAAEVEDLEWLELSDKRREGGEAADVEVELSQGLELRELRGDRRRGS